MLNICGIDPADGLQSRNGSEKGGRKCCKQKEERGCGKKKLTSHSRHCLYRRYDSLESFYPGRTRTQTREAQPQPRAPAHVPKSDTRPVAGALPFPRPIRIRVPLNFLGLVRRRMGGRWQFEINGDEQFSDLRP